MPPPIDQMSRDMTKPTKWVCAQRRFRSAWASAKDPSFLHADSEDSDQTGRMPRLIWVFAGRTATLLVLSCRGSNHIYNVLPLIDARRFYFTCSPKWTFRDQRYCCYKNRSTPKHSDTRKHYCYYPTIWLMWIFHRVMRPKDVDGMENSRLCSVWSGYTLFAQTCLSENLGLLHVGFIGKAHSSSPMWEVQ